MFKRIWDFLKLKITSFLSKHKSKIVTAIVLIITSIDGFYVLKMKLGNIATGEPTPNTSSVLFMYVILAFGLTFLAEKLFVGWKLNEEIKKGNQAAAIAFFAIAYIVIGILSKIL